VAAPEAVPRGTRAANLPLRKEAGHRSNAPAEAGRLRDALETIKIKVKLDIRAAKCVLSKGPCGF
jgi:hypothetical protein